MSSHVQNLSEKKTLKKNKTWVQKLLVIDDEVSDEEVLGEFVEAKERLEDCRMAVNSTLGKLGELYGSIEEFQADFSNVNKDIEDYYSLVEGETNKYKSSWLEMADDLGLEKNISVESLLLYMDARSHILRLSSKREDIKEEIINFKTTLSDAEALIYEWRKCTGSMKEGKIERVGAIVTEFRSILGYKDTKVKEVNLINEINYKTSINKKIETQIFELSSGTSKSWENTFKEFGVRKIPIDHLGWKGFFDSLQKMETLKEFMTDMSNVFSSNWEDVCFEIPLSFYFVEGINAEKFDHGFLEKLMSNVDQNHALLAYQDEDFDEKILNRKIPIGEKEVVKLEKKQAAKKKTPKKTVLNNSAYEALGMFKSKE